MTMCMQPKEDPELIIKASIIVIMAFMATWAWINIV